MILYPKQFEEFEAENDRPIIIHGTIVYLPTFLVDDYGICYKVGKYTMCVDGMGDDFQQESPFPTDSQISQIPC